MAACDARSRSSVLLSGGTPPPPPDPEMWKSRYGIGCEVPGALNAKTRLVAESLLFVHYFQYTRWGISTMPIIVSCVVVWFEDVTGISTAPGGRQRWTSVLDALVTTEARHCKHFEGCFRIARHSGMAVTSYKPTCTKTCRYESPSADQCLGDSFASQHSQGKAGSVLM